MQRLTRSPALALLAILVVAAFLRLDGLGSIPPGPYRDEAFNGLDTLDILAGHHSLYFPANNGREPMFIYLVAASVGLLGKTPFALRLPAALASLLTVPAAYLMARELFDRRAGLLAAGVLAVMFWPVHLAHIGLRAGLLPLFAALTVWQAARGWRTGQVRHWAAAGMLYGLSFYTYSAARFTPLVVIAFGVYAWMAHPGQRVAILRAALVFGATALAAAAPLGVYALGHWDTVMGRAGQVTIFNPGIGGPNPWLTLGRNIIAALGMFVWRGDFSARQNLPLRPVFDPVMGVLFLAGVGLALARARRNAAYALLLVWTAGMLLPTILAEDTPHFLRAVGVLPAVAVFPAVALRDVADKTSEVARRILFDQSRVGDFRSPGFWPALIVVPVLAVNLAFTANDYMGRYAHDPSVGFWFDDAGAQLAAEANRFTGAGWTGSELWVGGFTPLSGAAPATDRHVYMDEGLRRGFVNTQFLLAQPSAVTSIKTGEQPPAAQGGPTLLLLWPYSDWQRDLALLPQQARLEFREGAMVKGDRDPEPVVAYYAISAEPYQQPPTPLARLQGGIQLVEARIEGTRVRLLWAAMQKPDADYAVFVHVERAGLTIAQHDGDPAGGLYPTSLWRPGDIVVDEHMLPGGWDPARDRVWAGMYRRDNGQRLAMLDANGQPAGDRVQINVKP